MSTAVPSQHPAVVLRSQYNHLRALLAFMLIAMVGLSVALILVADEEAPVVQSQAAPVDVPGVHAHPLQQDSGVRYDGGPEEGTAAIAVPRAEIPTVAPPASSIAAGSAQAYEELRQADTGTRYDGGPEEGTRGATTSAVSTAPVARYDGGPEEGTRGATTSAVSTAPVARYDGGPEEGTRGATGSTEQSSAGPTQFSGSRP
jgi:hypothetical protein